MGRGRGWGVGRGRGCSLHLQPGADSGDYFGGKTVDLLHDYRLTTPFFLTTVHHTYLEGGTNTSNTHPSIHHSWGVLVTQQTPTHQFTRACKDSAVCISQLRLSPIRVHTPRKCSISAANPGMNLWQLVLHRAVYHQKSRRN